MRRNKILFDVATAIAIFLVFNSERLFAQHEKRKITATPESQAITDDPVARELLKQAHNNRYTWDGSFPGFAAEVTFSENTRTFSGEVKVAADGKVQVLLEEAGARTWVERTLHSIVMHRLARPFEKSSGQYTLTLGSKDDEPGEVVYVHGDGMNSSFRIRDGQIRQVKRTMKDRKFTIEVLENARTADGKFLPRHFMVSYYDPRTETLIKKEEYTDRYLKVGDFYLPEFRKVQTTENGEQMVRILTLRRHK